MRDSFQHFVQATLDLSIHGLHFAGGECRLTVTRNVGYRWERCHDGRMRMMMVIVWRLRLRMMILRMPALYRSSSTMIYQVRRQYHSSLRNRSMFHAHWMLKYLRSFGSGSGWFLCRTSSTGGLFVRGSVRPGLCWFVVGQSLPPLFLVLTVALSALSILLLAGRPSCQLQRTRTAIVR